MKYLQYRWKRRLLIAMTISILVSVSMVMLETTPWAEQVNKAGYSHGECEGECPAIPSVLRYILPFVKEFILIGVPMLLTVFLMKLSERATRKRH